MNSTLRIVLITVAAVHIVNFLVLWADEEFFGWKYEDQAKRVCCLTAYLLLLLFLAPVIVYRKIQWRKNHPPKYYLYRTMDGSAWNDEDGEVFICKCSTYPDAYGWMMDEVKDIGEEHDVDLSKFVSHKNGEYIFGDDEHAVHYKIIKR